MTPRVNRRRHADEGLGLDGPPSSRISTSTSSDNNHNSDRNSGNDDGGDNSDDASSFYIDPPPLVAVNTPDEAFILRMEISEAERDLVQKVDVLKRLAFVVCTLPVVLGLALYYQAQTLYWWLFVIPLVGVVAIIVYRIRLLKQLKDLRIDSLSRSSTLLTNNNASRLTFMPMEVTISIDDDVPLPPPTYQASLQIPPAYLSQLLRKVPSYASFSSHLEGLGFNRPTSTAQEQASSSSSISSPITTTTTTDAHARWSTSSNTLTVASVPEQVHSSEPQQQQQLPPTNHGVEMVQTNPGASTLARAILEGQHEARNDAESSSSTSPQSVVIDLSMQEASSRGQPPS
ncbi:hypothetical protein DFQ26_004505 [Actinomortierella ambigua]|nr:hypothetical protein DFQ26_004505 [Actinomortierella ambigua]